MPEPMGGFMFVWPFIIGAFLAYLVGSVPFGLIISKIFNLPDPRKKRKEARYIESNTFFRNDY